MDIRNKMNIRNKIDILKDKYAFLKQPKYMILNVILLVAILVQGTFAWIHLTQHVNGALLYIHETYPVELHKYQRQADGTYTEIPMEDVGFVLYKENGEQIEAVFWTDEDGKIYTELPVGNYFWKEIYYTTGWGPDIDENGNSILTYSFEVTDDIEEDDPLIIVAYNLPLEADLEVEKIIVNLDGSELSESQLEQEFEFYIYFSDEGTYKYYITDASNVIVSHMDSDYRSFVSRVYGATGSVEGAGTESVSDVDGTDDGIEWLEITSRETIYLKHGQVAVIQDLPVGITYSVHETRVVNYYTDSVGHLGNIVYGENRAVFTNTYDPIYGSLLVSKEVVNDDGSELTEEQLEKEFLFTATIDGEEVQFVLKHGEEHLIADIPVGTKYRVEEFDYIDHEYYATVLVYEGEILGEYEHYLPFVNVYDPEEELGDLIVRKVLVMPDGEEVELDYDLEFTFEVTFEYEDGTTRTEEFTLTGDEFGDPSLWKIFEDIPVGTKYTIREIGTGGYLPESDYVEGYIVGRVLDDKDLDLEDLVVSAVDSMTGTDTSASVESEEVGIDESELVETVLEDGLVEDKNSVLVFGDVITDDSVVEDDNSTPSSDESNTLEESFEFNADGVSSIMTLLDNDILTEEELAFILESMQVVTFYNRPEITKTLEITKEVVGLVPVSDVDKEFLIRLLVDGKLVEEFTLTAGQIKSFEVPLGATYEIWEADYLEDGYSQLIVNGYGSIWRDLTEVTVINEYIWEEVYIEGEKTWSDLEEALDYIPESIVVRLMLGDMVIEEQVVEPNENGLWLYEFAAPKYDLYGQEYDYRVEEVPLDYFYPVYDGYDIHNEFVESITAFLPVLEKQVIGQDAPEEKFGFVLRGILDAPMPAGSGGDELVYIQYGAGEQALGEIRYTQPGIYYYTIRELMGESGHWVYDQRIYDLEVVVLDLDGELSATYTLYLGDEVVDRAVFVNEYNPLEDTHQDLEHELDQDLDLDPPVEEVVVTGNKTWNHGSNPVEEQPKNLVVYLLADGEVIRAVEINNGTNWSYSFTVPKYDEYGVIMVYSIEEELVPGYVASGEGYNLVNTFDLEYQEDQSGAQTGDYTNILVWLFSMIGSVGLYVTLLYGRVRRY